MSAARLPGCCMCAWVQLLAGTRYIERYFIEEQDHGSLRVWVRG